jgi:tetratricopeptide (TPR) repeat protein
MGWALDICLTHALKATDRGAAAGLWIRAARAAVRVGGAPAEAQADHLRRALQSDPFCLEAQMWLAERALDAGDWAAAEQLVEGAAVRPALDPIARGALLLLLSDLRRRLEKGEGSRTALAEAMRLPSAPWAEIARRAASLGDPLLAAEAQRAELSLAAGDGEAREMPVAERIAHLKRLAELQLGQLGRPREGFDTLARALALNPLQPEIWDTLERLAIAEGLGVQLTALYRELAAAPGAPAELARRLARQVGPERSAALAAWRRVLELSPGDAEATAALREGLTQSRRPIARRGCG